MSTRDDSRLTAQERALLANLEASATAADPQFAARLGGSGRYHLVARLADLPGWVRSLWASVPAVIVGLALTMVSLSTSLVVGVVGAVILAVGLCSLVADVRRRWGEG